MRECERDKKRKKGYVCLFTYIYPCACERDKERGDGGKRVRGRGKEDDRMYGLIRKEVVCVRVTVMLSRQVRMYVGDQIRM